MYMCINWIEPNVRVEESCIHWKTKQTHTLAGHPHKIFLYHDLW